MPLKNGIPLLLFLLLGLASCKEGAKQEPIVPNRSFVKILEAPAYKKLLDQSESPQLIDVRTANEVARGVLPGAAHNCVTCPGFETRLGELDKDQPVFVYCKMGGRSARAAAIMKRMDFKQIYDLEGGVEDWQASGYELTYFRHGNKPPAGD